MRNLLLILLSAISISTTAQSLSSSDSTLFDFWVGNWELTWTNASGEIAHGTNHIVRILDNRVIQENFLSGDGKLKGMSLSVYNSQNKTWHQAWADNTGSYFDFVGKAEGDKRIFMTKMKEVKGKKIIQRMVFYNIKKDTLTWDWEMSNDGGDSWQLQWRINYKRKS